MGMGVSRAQRQGDCPQLDRIVRLIGGDRLRGAVATRRSISGLSRPLAASGGVSGSLAAHTRPHRQNPTGLPLGLALEQVHQVRGALTGVKQPYHDLFSIPAPLAPEPLPDLRQPEALAQVGLELGDVQAGMVAAFAAVRAEVVRIVDVGQRVPVDRREIHVSAAGAVQGRQIFPGVVCADINLPALVAADAKERAAPRGEFPNGPAGICPLEHFGDEEPLQVGAAGQQPRFDYRTMRRLHDIPARSRGGFERIECRACAGHGGTVAATAAAVQPGPALSEYCTKLRL